MNTKNILIFLILLNASAAFVGQTDFAKQTGVELQIGGGDQIERAEQQAKNINVNRNGLDSFVGAIIAATSIMTTMVSVVVAGPAMLINLGAPAPLVVFIAAPIYVLIGLDIAYMMSGRQGLI